MKVVAIAILAMTICGCARMVESRLTLEQAVVAIGDPEDAPGVDPQVRAVLELEAGVAEESTRYMQDMESRAKGVVTTMIPRSPMRKRLDALIASLTPAQDWHWRRIHDAEYVVSQFSSAQHSGTMASWKMREYTSSVYWEIGTLWIEKVPGGFRVDAPTEESFSYVERQLGPAPPSPLWAPASVLPP